MNMEAGLHMNVGEGETSYAKNSQSQKGVVLKSKPIIEKAIKLFCAEAIPKTMYIADLGCSSGPNSFLPASMIIDALHESCITPGRKIPDLHIFLNDLPENDFNTVFKLARSFKQKLKDEKGDKLGSCFVAGSPGSFYDRLFPDQSMHFVYSANSVHWLSKVPPFEEKGVVNKGNIALGRSSPSYVHEMYMEQYQRDFPGFLALRSQEIVPNGCMVFTTLGRTHLDPFDNECYSFWDALAHALRDMAEEGIVEEAKLDSFNMPYYGPHQDEVKKAIEDEGSFNIIQLEQNYVNMTNCKVLANSTRAAVEPLLIKPFGTSVMDELFKRFEDKLSEGGISTLFYVVSLTRKG